MKKFPVSLPESAEVVRSVGIKTIGLQLVTGCYLSYSDQSGASHDVPVSLEQIGQIIEFLEREALQLPLNLQD